MKQLYYSLLLLGFSFLVSAQNSEGTPVEGLIPITRTDSPEQKTLNVTSEFNVMSEMQSVATTAPTGNSTEVGITEGELAVSLSGGATYNVPIKVPKGINGIVPQISLAYNSQGGNGLAGYGWNIAGISKITRIPSTKFHDGIIDGVDFDYLDRFALDGQRLIVKNGTGATYGANGTIYETENHSNVKITSYGVHPNGATYGPAYFLVEYPDGSKAEYGNTTNRYGSFSESRTLTTWAITYWENPQGVRISYLYGINNNNLRIINISYGNIGNPLDETYNEIQFVYKTRQRPEQTYVGGQSIIDDKILDKILVNSFGVGYRRYELTYEANSLSYERLKTITEKSGDNTKSYNPTVFSYDNTVNSISYADITTSLGVGNITSLNADTVSGDFDGDEKMEFLIYPTTGTDSKKKYWFFSNIDSGNYMNIGAEHNVGAFETIFPTSWLSWNNHLMPKQGWTVVKKTDANYTFTVYSAGTVSPIYYQYERVVNFPIEPYGSSCYSAKIILKKIISGDFNGDGLTDVIAIDNACFSKKVYFVDLKRDNTSNFLTYSGELLAYMSTSSKVEVADVNGDGKSDFMVFENGKVTSYTLNNNNQLVLLWDYSDANISVDTSKTILLGDYNGDGKTDFIIPSGYGSTTWYKYSSTGTSFIKVVETYSGIQFRQNTTSYSYIYLASDYDKDGKSDLIETVGYKSSTNSNGQITVLCYFNRNGTFWVGDRSQASSSYSTDINLYPLPIYLASGKGAPTKDKPYKPTLEIAFANNNKIFYFNSNKNNVQDQLLKSITTGNGVQESITYKPLNTDYDENYNTIYNSSYSENYPNSNIESASSMQVVSMLEKQSATDYKKQLFSYYDAISNMEGLGFLGFKSTAKTNWFDDNNPIITTVSKFDTNLRGANTENYTVLGQYNASDYAAPSNFISKTTSNYNSSLEANKVFNLKVTASQQYNGLDNTSTETTDIVYDTNNNPLTSTTYLKNGSTTEQTTISNITYATPTSSPYVVGRLINKTQSVAISGDTMTSEEQYVYNTGGLLTQVKKKGHNTNFITEDNIYDEFGNITKKTISAPGLIARETNYEYDPAYGGIFLTKSTDIEGLSTTFVYNGYNGLLLSETNPYGLSTSYTYDSWFKKTKTTDYLGKSINMIYTRNGANATITTTGDDGSYSEELYDDLGRKITASVKDINGNTSSVSYLYDIYDRNYKISEPYSGGSPSQWNEIQYDEYGRTTQNISFTGKTTSISYSGLTTTVNDGTKTKIAAKNAIGNMVTMTDSPGGTINYTYFANGNLKSSDYGGVVTSIEQDGWGRKTKLTDPSAGIYTYTYNDLGEALTQTTPNGTTTYTLNSVGKPTQKTIVGTNTNSTTTYAYDSTTKLLTSSTFVDALGNNATTTTMYTYDGNKRLTSSIETTPYATFTKQLTYDAFGRLNTETSIASAAGKSSSKTVQHTYKNGKPWQIIDAANSQVLWQTNTVNARGQLTEATMANANITVSNAYDSYGLMTQTKQDRLIISPGNIMTLNTVFDPQKGNLTSRTNSLFNWSEDFTNSYDSLDRLTSFKNIAGVTETQSYDDRGRITQNAVGTYNYTNTSKVYRNTSVTVTPDALTHYQTNHEQNISYNAFKSPYQIEEAGKDKISFTYNDANNRSSMFYGSLDNDKLLRPLRKYYSADGSMEIKHNIATGAIEFVTYIGGDGYTAPIVLKSDGTTQNYLYLQRDYQGSIVAISDTTGQVLEKRLFDAWGNVLVQDGAGNVLNGLTLLDRGYTGHEHLQSVGLIHMNGRLYDAKLHRFLQPDNNVQDPNNTQNYNRYSYVLNNPLKYTDWTGEKWKIGWKDVFAGLEIIGGTALTIFSGGTLAVVGAGLISAGVTHFAAAYNEYKQTGDWASASNNAGIFFNVSFNTDFGYNNNKDKQNGVNQNTPVVTPKSDTNGGGNGGGKDKGYDSWFYENQYFGNEGGLRVGTYLDFSPIKKLLGITIGEYRESGYNADYYHYEGNTTKNYMNHYFVAGFAVGGGINYKYNLGEDRFESFSLSLFGFSAEYSKQSSYQRQFYIGLDTGFSLGIGVGGSENIKGGWRWNW
ncbi:FG-GAP-like repeat-containing protein [Flavobacterium undicola]|uniref:FG-GAP-like repeat-containing protein n=1 Tax=Flavobacterium undicola TaxID=1932779 RepID=UPI001378F11C|nr:FG-GAP-like repeat-containing protein [Flavobacterium undicola]MBA0883035.1 VCBS repeat-containing protein [Flavobacterium undicola]